MPAAGIVSIHDKRINLSIGQCVPLQPLTRPVPAMAPVTVCVVDTGTPNSVAARIIAAALVSAVHPRKLFNFVILLPMVWTIRHPPARVPKLMTSWHEITTQKGT